MQKRIPKLIVRYCVFALVAFSFFSTFTPASATSSDLLALSEKQLDIWSQNNISFYDPFECRTTGKGASSNSCFKIDDNAEASDLWYGEGCLDNGTCTKGVYASTKFTNKYNEFLLSDTETDESFGGMQYIYAENYDIEFGGYEGWIAKFTPNGGNSSQKYYWIVLPAQAYSTGFGETYVATFENLDEPIYFITYDTHQCGHQKGNYCEKAEANPDGVAIGEEFFGALTKDGGAYREVVDIAGKLTSFCRIKGQGEVTASSNAGNASAIKTSGSSSGSSSSSTDASAVENGLTLEQAQILADYYNGDDVTVAEFDLPSGTKENCVSLVAWVEAFFGDFYPDHTRVTWGDGYEITSYLAQHYNVPTGTEPKLFSIFSTKGGHWHSDNHTGFIVGINGNKVISIEAAYGGWKGGMPGIARVFEMEVPSSGIEYAYIADRLDFSKMAEIVGSFSYSNSSQTCKSGGSGSAIAPGEAASILLDDRMTWLFPDGPPQSEAEAEQYMEWIEVPIIDESGERTTMMIRVHKKLATEVKAIFEEMANVPDFRIHAKETYGFSFRYMSNASGSPNNLSYHSYGSAIDINPTENPDARSSSGAAGYNPGGNYYSVTEDIVKIWERHGFFWGGYWSPAGDYMHFSYTNN